MTSLYQFPWKLLLLSTFLSACAADIGLPVNLDIDYNLNSEHVRVSHTRVAEGFITNIQNIGIAKLKSSYPDRHFEVINGVSGPSIQSKDVTLALERYSITEASEEKTKVWGKRKQKNHAKGSAWFSVRDHGSGAPTSSAGEHPNLKQYAQLVAEYAQLYGQLLGQGSSGGGGGGGHSSGKAMLEESVNEF